MDSMDALSFPPLTGKLVDWLKGDANLYNKISLTYNFKGSQIEICLRPT